MNNNKTIRAFFRAVKCDRAQPPYDTIHLKVTYPAHVRHQPTALTALNQLLNSANSLIHEFDCK
jgi:hypothetical protein